MIQASKIIGTGLATTLYGINLWFESVIKLCFLLVALFYC